jgi:hypothetical protein
MLNSDVAHSDVASTEQHLHSEVCVRSLEGISWDNPLLAGIPVSNGGVQAVCDHFADPFLEVVDDEGRVPRKVGAAARPYQCLVLTSNAGEAQQVVGWYPDSRTCGDGFLWAYYQVHDVVLLQ